MVLTMTHSFDVISMLKRFVDIGIVSRMAAKQRGSEINYTTKLETVGLLSSACFCSVYQLNLVVNTYVVALNIVLKGKCRD